MNGNDTKPLFSAEAPLGIPNENSNKRQKTRAQGTVGRGYLFPLPVVPRSLSFSPLPMTRGGLCGGERDKTETCRSRKYTHLSIALLASAHMKNAKKIAVLQARLSALRHKIMIMRTKSF